MTISICITITSFQPVKYSVNNTYFRRVNFKNSFDYCRTSIFCNSLKPKKLCSNQSIFYPLDCDKLVWVEVCKCKSGCKVLIWYVFEISEYRYWAILPANAFM